MKKGYSCFQCGAGKGPPVWERAVHSVHCACLLRTFIFVCALPLCLASRVGCGILSYKFLINAFLFTLEDVGKTYIDVSLVRSKNQIAFFELVIILKVRR